MSLLIADPKGYRDHLNASYFERTVDANDLGENLVESPGSRRITLDFN